MIVFEQLNQQLNNHKNLLHNISEQQFIYSSKYLSNSSIGSHSRHIIELLNCAINGYKTGKIDYNNRLRNLDLERNLYDAIAAIENIQKSMVLEDKNLQIITEDNTLITSTFYREMLYNLEHVIHHLALIKVSLIELDLKIVDNNFGMAYSTIKYKHSLQNS